ncbi:MmcQ/YjbR family DNA-binding protein [Psychrobium sp. 1_MG-2023]|uniref:MmcQ/YjbR family DNA-binding protein n=1 Tax=Psychrobium sp. 1_MG-2023 TaxID=3062624 RepID=UPI000C344F4B|nr:MmcQ/YjbR family DNA-binding protein [Psychrobium sp. 1_MG-2023]MDP2560269.1 MmcQ/YjbR family DNA-binding protein [Psychrobium sp. 1_MG-2023]PKF55386.1 hypothetical protein CW748_12845 [Alteromonadales bacterium alter-6D02]
MLSQNHLKAYLLNKPFAVLDFPFGEEVMVFKVKHKMFATLSRGKGKDTKTEQPWWLNLKCDPDEALALRDIFESIIPGYHMNKRLWNTVIIDGSIPTGEIERMIDNSFNLVVSNLPKKEQRSIVLKNN